MKRIISILAFAVIPLSSASGKNRAPLPFLALGDSYTVGEGVEAPASWPAQLAARLRSQKIPLADPLIIAKTGWTTDDLARAVDSEHLQPSYGLVTLLIGVNNQFRGRDVDEYRAQFKLLLLRAVQLAGGKAGRVLVLSIPDWGATPFGQGQNRVKIAREIDRFNAVNRDETFRVGARYVDITEPLRWKAAQPAMVAADGLHPSAAMYAEWVALALPLASEMLK